MLNEARVKMFEARLARPRPHRDDKILTAWNGLMIGAFARMARLLRGFAAEDPAAAGHYLDAARRAAAFIRERMWNAGTRTLLRRYRDGVAEIEADAEDYAYLISGLLELFQADPAPMWLEWAIALQHQQDALFWDDAGGGWFSTTGRDPSVLLRLKEDYDGAEPSASSVSVLNLLALAHLVDDDEARKRAERTLARYGARAGRAARAIPMMLAGLSTWHAGGSQIVIVGDEGSAMPLWSEAARHYRPFALQIPVCPGAAQAAIAGAVPFIGAMRPVNGEPTAFVCGFSAAGEPVTTPEALAAQLAPA